MTALTSRCSSIVLFALLSACGGQVSGDLVAGAAELSPACPVKRCAGKSCDAFKPTAEYQQNVKPGDLQSPTNFLPPPPPLITRQLRVAEDGKYLRPSIPPQRTSGDGRVAITQGAALMMVELEKLKDTPLMRAPTQIGADIFGNHHPLTDLVDPAVRSKYGEPELGEVSLCQAERAQPHMCTGDDGNTSQDCYDLVVIQHAVVTVGSKKESILQSVPITIQVSAPKTKQAEITRITLHRDQWKHTDPAPFTSIVEGLHTRDGHVLMGRLLTDNNPAGQPSFNVTLTYALNAPGKTNTRFFSLFYAYAKDACDVQQWMAHDGATFTSLRPLPAAPFDHRLHVDGDAKREVVYGFAARQMRDSFGALLPEDGYISGSYPWVDRDARNVMFSTAEPNLFADGATWARFPVKKESSGPYAQIGSSPRGFAVIGNWTEGKMVLLDGIINNDDYGTDPDDTHDYQLYRSSDHGPISVRVNGGGKDNTSKLKIPNAIENNHHIDSLENLMAMHTRSLAVTPRDVVWTISRGLASDEVAFDDYVDPHLILLAEMNGAWTLGASGRAGTLADGFFVEAKTHGWGFDPQRIRLQNAATSPVYPLAEPGYLVGPGRLEPVAAGGVHGRGLWLEQGSAARFPLGVDTSKKVGASGFYASVFVDAREGLSGSKHLFSLRPKSGEVTEVTLEQLGSVLQISHGSDHVAFDISCLVGSYDHAWHHIGVLFSADGGVTPFLDGNAVNHKVLPQPVRLTDGDFVVGGAAPSGATGIRGWYDEARLVVNGGANALEGAGSVELLCNYAMGMTVAADTSVSTPTLQLAKRLDYAHARAAGLHATPPPRGRLLACATDYTGDLTVGRGVTPAHSVAYHDEILLEGTRPLEFNVRRPDSTQRTFCRSCHISAVTDADRTSSLTLVALQPGTVAAEADPRTQPMQPEQDGPHLAPLARGVIPADWITAPDGLSFPTVADHTPGDPVPLLRWVFRNEK